MSCPVNLEIQELVKFFCLYGYNIQILPISRSQTPWTACISSKNSLYATNNFAFFTRPSAECHNNHMFDFFCYGISATEPNARNMQHQCNTNNPVKVLNPVRTTVILTLLQISALSRNIVRNLNSGVLNRNSLNGRNPIHDIARPWIKSLNSPPFHILLKQIWDLHTCQSISGLIFCHIHHL